VPGLALAVQGGGQLRAAGRWGPERADLTVTLTALPAALAERFVPNLQPQGTVSGEVRVTGPVGRPDIKATLQGSGLRSGANWALGLPPLTLRAEASMAGEAAQLRAEIDAGPAGRLTATARLPGGFGPQAPLAAALEGNLALAPLAGPFLAAGADRVSGRIAVALRAEGTVGTPQLGGRATLSGGGYRNTEYGVRIDNLAGTVVGDGTRLVIQQLQGRTPGGGSITLSGSLDAGAPGLPADITLTARNARPVTSDLVTATIGADLRLTGPLLGGGSLAGEVRVQQAEIRVPERLPASVPTLTNVRQIGRQPGGAAAPPPPPPPPPAAVTPAAPPINLAVRVLAPRAVFIRGRGIDVEMGGEVAIGGTTAAPVPQGQLTLRSGTLDVLARRLTFQRGTIGFVSGTLTPQLDLTATAQARQTTITVKVQGTPAAPEVTFTSTPELPQDEILARLLFDRATSNLSPFEIVQLASAIGQLTGIGGGTGALDRVRGALGLDRLGITSDTAGTGAAVEAGRYVAPGVFLGVRQGQSGQTGVGVQVEITPRLKLEGQTATGPAGDRLGLSYEFEY
jgi:translocation and assembly module TamB